MVEDIAVYSLYKTRKLIIPCKADGFCLFIALPDEIKKKVVRYRYPILTLRKHYIIKAT